MARQAVEAVVARTGRAEALAALLDRLTDELLSAPSLDEQERRAKAISTVLKARQSLDDMERVQQPAKGEDGHMDAADEQTLRDRILARLDGLVAGLEQKGADRCPACGRVEPDRDGLERVVAQIAETA